MVVGEEEGMVMILEGWIKVCIIIFFMMVRLSLIVVWMFNVVFDFVVVGRFKFLLLILFYERKCYEYYFYC